MESATIEISEIGHGGVGVGIVITGDTALIGIRALCKETAPGETVVAEITQREPRLLHCVPHEIVNPNPERRDPPCPYFGTCGGCQLQHISIAAQRNAKQQMLKRAFERAGMDVMVEDASGDLPEFEYRRRVLLRIGENGVIGFYREGTGDIVAIDRCMISRPRINQFINDVKPSLKDIAASVRGVALEEHADGPLTCMVLPRDSSRPVETHELAQLCDRIIIEGAKESDTSPIEFSQVNAEGNEILRSLVLEALPSRGRITEFYAGGGNFTLPLLERGNKVDAVEVVPTLARELKQLAAQKGLGAHVAVFNESTEKFVRRGGSVSETVLLDPPRGGAAVLCKQLSPTATSTIVYVSCYPPTLIRDLGYLVKNGFAISQVKMVDMFSQTQHVEVVVALHSER